VRIHNECGKLSRVTRKLQFVGKDTTKIPVMARILLRLITLLTLVALVLIPTAPGTAQETTPGPVYIVQEGDTLWSIAIQFGVSVDDLQEANGLSNANQLAIGDRLVIPGMEGVLGVIVTERVPYGETLRSLSRRYEIPVTAISQLNRLTSPSELFLGSYLIIPEGELGANTSGRALLAPGQSLLELAALNHTNPWKLVEKNALQGTWHGLAGDVLRLPVEGVTSEASDGPGALPEEITYVSITPQSPLQGKTTVIEISATQGMRFSGTFMGHELQVFPDESGGYFALQGVHAMTEPGVYPLRLEGERSDGTVFVFSQMVRVSAVEYPYDRPLTVDPATIDPAVTRPEDAIWTQLAVPATSERLWESEFEIPSPLPKEYCVETGECWSSRYGNRRSYNGSPYNSFHTGLDIVGGTGTEIFAPAPGIVVFAGPLTVRGNATMIDHGWGVYTAYMHQEEIFVQVGDMVDTGQVIGIVGATGRVEGPHLHWEVWAGGVQVDPLDWLQGNYP